MKIQAGLLSGKQHPADLFIAGVFEKEALDKHLAGLDAGFAASAKAALDKGRFSGKAGEVFSYYAGGGKAAEIGLIGLGAKKAFSPACFRKAAGQIIALSKNAKAHRVRILLDTFVASGVGPADAAGLVAEIGTLALYDFDRYKTKDGKESKKSPEPAFELVFGKSSSLKSAQKKIQQHQIIAESTLVARDLINEPGNIMHPQRLAQEARKLAAKYKISCRIIGLAELKRLKMGGILAVNQGSKTPPALIVLEYGRSHKSKGTVCLVGKGVTFDTGGISIKPAKDMEKMKYDMSGAAAVIGTITAAARLRIPQHVVVLAPAVENMVAEDPQRPGDIIRMHNGKTVEVLNTDAEGRLILADALTYSKKFKPKALIDVATLTGMAAYTFGEECCAVLGTDEKLVERLRRAGDETGERAWQLPLYPEYARLLKGHHSDLYNIGGPYAGTITAALFLKEFVAEKTSWAHLDIAGTAWANSPRYDCVKGGTGFGVRLLTQYIQSLK